MSISVNSAEFPLKMFHATPRAMIGWGAYQMAGLETKAVGIKHALLVTSGLKGTGIVEEIVGVLKYAGVEVTVYDGVTTNPKDYEAHAAHKMYREAGCDGVVSLGGGSSHDCGKAVRIIEHHDGASIHSFDGFNDFKTPITIPQVAITTTCGTGSETTNAAVITNTEKKYKMIMFERSIVCTQAIIDPALMRLLPPHLTAWTGMDALTHAVEAYTSRMGLYTSMGMAISAVKLIAENLRNAYGNGNNDQAREKMAWAQYSAGHAINSAGAGVVHSMAHSLGGYIDLPHGRCNSIILADAQRYNLVACPELYADIARAMGVNTTGMTDIQAAEKAVEEMEKLRDDLGVTEKLSDLGLKAEDVDKVAEFAMHDVCKDANPRTVNIEDVKDLFHKCM